jgi:F420-dependent oxidoreductase-like protein
MNKLIRMGLQLPLFTYPGVEDRNLFGRVASIAQAAEASRFDSVWVMDHFYQLPGLGKPQAPMFEAYTLLSALAGVTKKVNLGALVGGVTYRNPAFLAKTVTTLDVISQGRAIWGIGAAWFELEHNNYGYDFGTFGQRFEKLEEALQIVKSMFVNEQTTFHGKWYQVTDALNSPKPIRAGGPPVLIGGSGEKKTLRMVAQYADACNVFGPVSKVRSLMSILDEHCSTLGRDPATICRTRLGTLVLGDTKEQAEATVAGRFGAKSIADLPANTQSQIARMTTYGSAESVGEEVQSLLDAGLTGHIFNLPAAHNIDSVHRAGEVLAPLLLG